MPLARELPALASVLTRILAAAPTAETIDEIARFVERLAPRARCAVLSYDAGTQHLKFCSAPSTGAAFAAAHREVPVGGASYPCGRAAAHRSMVVVDDLGREPAMTDSLRSAGLSDVQACWASPVLDADDQLLGTISLYALENRPPSRAETSVLAIGAALTGLVLARQREAERRRRSEALHSTLADVSPDGALVHRNGEVLCANGGIARLLGRDPGEPLAGRSLSALVGVSAGARIAALRAGSASIRWQRPGHGATDLVVTSTPYAFQGRDATLSVWRDAAPAPGVGVPAGAEEDRAVADMALALREHLAQPLAGAALLMAGIARRLENVNNGISSEISRVAVRLRATASRARTLAATMVPLTMAGNDLPRALERLAARADAPPHRQVACWAAPGVEVAISGPAAEQLFRIAEEALADAIGNASPSHVTIFLSESPAGIRLTVVDDGAREDASRGAVESDALRGIERRAGLIGAALRVTPARPRGTIIDVRVPHASAPVGMVAGAR